MSERKAPAGGIIRASLDNTWRTPERILGVARRILGDPLPLDAATSSANTTRAARYCSVADPMEQAQTRLWSADPVDGESIGCGLDAEWDWPWWCNPPYGRELKRWLAKMASEARRRPDVPGLALLPCARWEQPYLTDALAQANALCLIRGRVAFVSSIDGEEVGGNPYANMIVGFNCWFAKFSEAAALGPCFKLSPLNSEPTR